LHIGGQIIGMSNLLEWSPYQLFVRVAHDVAELGVDQQPPAIQGQVGYADCGLLERATKTLFTRPQGLFGLLAVRDIDKAGHHMCDLPIRPERGNGVALEPPPLPVRPKHTERVAAYRTALPQSHSAGPLVGRER